ncbi:M14 family zinc carboxypeptidase [Deltaproteobacteria bacterium TL4]
MKKFIILMVSLGCISWASFGIAEDLKSVVINTPILNVRHLPEGRRVRQVFQGQQFNILEKKEGWGLIEYEWKQSGWIHLDYVSPLSLGERKHTVQELCENLNQEIIKYKWSDIHCDPADWQTEAYSASGYPLLYAVLGKKPVTSILVCSVHSDENTLYHCFRLLKMLKTQELSINNQLVIVPLLNPDGFLRKYKTRTNSRNVDLNRNMPTRDWHILAHRMWQKNHHEDVRRYPGVSANSEPENQFLISLILRHTPDKVISIHAPLNFLDMDYTQQSTTDKNIEKIQKTAQALAVKFAKDSNIIFRDYRTFPGSLGRFGTEWNIPIYTIELPTAKHSEADHYFQQLQNSLLYSFNMILDKKRTASKEQPSAPLM